MVSAWWQWKNARILQRETNGQHVNGKVLWPFSLYLPTNTDALNTVRIIEVAVIAVSCAITFTISFEQWKLKTIYQFIVDVFTGNIWIITCWPRCPKHVLYFARLLHLGCVGYTNFKISIPLGIRYRRKVVIIIASRSVQIL